MSTAAYDVLTPAQISGLILPSDRYDVLAVMQTSYLTATGNEVDALEIAWALSGRPGVFSTIVPLTTFRVFESGIDLTSAAAEVEAIYAL